MEAFTVCKESCNCSSQQHIGRGGRIDCCARSKEKKLRRGHNTEGVAETGFELGNLLPVVVMRLSIPGPLSNEPLGSEVPGMTC